MNKIKVGILYGGRSVEHEISIRSASNILENIDQKKFEVYPIGIDKNGRWHFTSEISKEFGDADLLNLNLNPDNPVFNTKDGRSFSLDAVFPILHGTDGEDGSIQGFLQCMSIPYVGSGVLGSSANMNKLVTKQLLKQAGLSVADYVALTRNDEIDPDNIIKKLGSDLIVKPANLGSSVGVAVAKNEKELRNYIEDAFKYDDIVLVEEFVTGREMECAVFGNANPIASLPGEIILKGNHELYSYDAKYMDEKGTELIIPAEVDEDQSEKIKSDCIEAFKVTHCRDLARVDFFLTQDNRVIINEINTLPGFTSISMYPKLCELMGIGYTELISRFIAMAIERFNEQKKLETSYTSES